jgi:hypothetical protein
VVPVLGTVLLAALYSHAPVKVDACTVWTPQTSVDQDGIPQTSGRYTLHVRFVDDADQPIRRIEFALSDGTRVVDAGKFSPGVTIDQMLAMRPDDGKACSVAAVTFADGTHWSAQTAH